MQQADRPDVITNARFLDIGAKYPIVAGTLNGETFYSPPVVEIDGDLLKTTSGNFRFSRSIN